MRPTEHENRSKLDEMKTGDLNMAVNLGMMTGCRACADVEDQKKCFFCVISTRTNKCNSLRFGEYCDHFEAQKSARMN